MSDTPCSATAASQHTPNHTPRHVTHHASFSTACGSGPSPRHSCPPGDGCRMKRMQLCQATKPATVVEKTSRELLSLGVFEFSGWCDDPLVQRLGCLPLLRPRKPLQGLEQVLPAYRAAPATHAIGCLSYWWVLCLVVMPLLPLPGTTPGTLPSVVVAVWAVSEVQRWSAQRPH